MSYPDRLLLRGACALLGDELRFEPAPLDVLIEREYRGLAEIAMRRPRPPRPR